MGANKIKVAVCGGAGFIGSCLADRLVEFNPIYEVTIIDNLSTGKLSNVRAKHKFVKCDVNNYDDISAVFLSNRFDYVFMYNAVVGVSRTQNNPMPPHLFLGSLFPQCLAPNSSHQAYLVSIFPRYQPSLHTNGV